MIAMYFLRSARSFFISRVKRISDAALKLRGFTCARHCARKFLQKKRHSGDEADNCVSVSLA